MGIRADRHAWRLEAGVASEGAKTERPGSRRPLDLEAESRTWTDRVPSGQAV